MRINFSHWPAFSIPIRGWLLRASGDEPFTNGNVVSIRLWHFTSRFLASSLLIFSTVTLAATALGTLVFTGGNRPVSIIYRPTRFKPFFVGSQLLCVQRSRLIDAPRVAFIMWEYTSAYDQPPSRGV